ncbi:hypothetical protein DIPPA_09993 [Diplonema papillatum]|nr:hypothetical protein DIPPA_09993 [Diplonema papillatum]
MRLYGKFYSWLLVPGDSETQRIRKAIVPTYLLLVCVFMALVTLLQPDQNGVFFTSLLLFFWAAAFLAVVLHQKHVSDVTLSVCVAGGVVGTCVFDLDSAAGLKQRPWPLLVLLADLVLVCKLPTQVSVCLVSTGVVWLFITHTEAAFRFGLYDVPLTDSYSTRRMDCECSQPPCKRSVLYSMKSFNSAAFVFIMDYYITRGFAQKLLAQQEKMQRSIEAARNVSALLVQFQLAEAEALLVKCSSLGEGKGDEAEIPEEFVAVLSNLLSNLKRYEPFLPQSCFPYADDDSDDMSPRSEAARSSEYSIARPSLVSKISSLASTAPQLFRHHLQSRKSAEGSDYTRRTVSIAAFNVRCLHDMLGSRAPDNNDPKRQIIHLQEALLSLTVQSVSKAKGIVDFFMGDHVTCSWNASRPCVSHRNMSVLAAYEIGVGMQQADIVTHCGVSSGEALCGNVGTETLRRFNIVGHVYSLAHDIGSVAKDWETRLLVDTAVANEVKIAYEVVAVPETLIYCKGLISFSPLILWKVVRANDGEVGAEWMYTVQSPEMMRVNFMNQLTVAHLKGNQKEVESMLASHADDQPPVRCRACRVTYEFTHRQADYTAASHHTPC